MTVERAPVRRDGLLIVAGLLIGAGILGLIAEWAELDLGGWLNGSGWTLFIIVPGVILLAAGLLLRRPVAGLTIAGTIVTAVGALLLYQDRTGHYESWSYAWALIAPGAVGLGLVLHGLRANDHAQLTVGARMLAIAAAIFVVGAWYFETVFRTGRVPFDLGDSWPIVLVILGAIVLVLAFLGTGERTGSDRPKAE
jgi:hypothetical protein